MPLRRPFSVQRRQIGRKSWADGARSDVRKMRIMDSYRSENLCHDPIHGYIPFVASVQDAKQEICERQIIDHLWVQRMRQIRQLQTAWWVFPTAEHSRFQHVLGVMHLASRAIAQLHASLLEVDSTTPSRNCIESLVRMAGLLHDVGHGPFGHFFDEHFLKHFDLDHERLGAFIIQTQLKEVLSSIQCSPNGRFRQGEHLDPADMAWLIQRPKSETAQSDEGRPKWLRLLRSLFCGIYTIDNMDFVLRDAFMTGLNPRSFDLQRLLHYSQFTESGLTIHERGVHALVHFLGMKAELFRDRVFSSHRSRHRPSTPGALSRESRIPVPWGSSRAFRCVPRSYRVLSLERRASVAFQQASKSARAGREVVRVVAT